MRVNAHKYHEHDSDANGEEDPDLYGAAYRGERVRTIRFLNTSGGGAAPQGQAQRQRMQGLIVAGVLLLTLVLGASKISSLQTKDMRAQAQVKDLKEQLHNMHTDSLLLEKDEANCCQRSQLFTAKSVDLERQLKACQDGSVKDHKEAQICKGLNKQCSTELLRVNDEVKSMTTKIEQLTKEVVTSKAAAVAATAAAAKSASRAKSHETRRSTRRTARYEDDNEDDNGKDQ